VGNVFQVMLAVQAAPEIEMTPAKTIAGLLLFLTIAASFGTGVSWLIRMLQGQHPLPAARRSPLQTPPMAMLWTAVLTLPMAVLALMISLNELTATAPAEATAADSAAASAATVAEADATDATPAETEPADIPPAQLQRRRVQMVLEGIAFNALMVLVLGFVVWRYTVKRRLLDSPVAETPAFAPIEPPAGVRELSGWGDLNFGTADWSAAQTPWQPAQAVQAAAAPEPALERLHLPTELRYALQVFLAVVLPSMLFRFLLVLVITQLTGSVPDRNPLLEILDSETGPLLLLLIVLTAVVVAPIAEELQFRVVLLGGLQQAGFPRLAVLLSSTLFTLAHGFPDCIALVPLTAALCYTWQRRRSYLTCVLVHFLFNLFNILLAVLVLF